MEYALKELLKVVKAMTRKVIHLEEEIMKVNVNSKNTQMNEPFKDTYDYRNYTPNM